MTPGELISFLLYTMMIASPIGNTGLYSQFQRAEASGGLRAARRRPSARRSRCARAAAAHPGGVASCTSASTTAIPAWLGRCSADRPGGGADQVVALVGPSGAGKTTLVALNSHLLRSHRGVHHNQRSTSAASPSAPCASESASCPETALFSRSVRDNIRYGKLDATQAEIEAAAGAANAHISSWTCPSGTIRWSAAQGEALSGGQRQRHRPSAAQGSASSSSTKATSSLDSESG